MTENGRLDNPQTSTVRSTPASKSTKQNAETKEEHWSKQRAFLFKISHALQIIFFLWLFSLHLIGIYIFTKGFLLTRLVLDYKSECNVPPIEIASLSLRDTRDGCWYPRTFNKAVIIIIDALRYDFTIPYHAEDNGGELFFRNSIPTLYDTAVETPSNAILLPFIADPPTTTLQRLKGLTTGTLPTFHDAGSNFAGMTIEEDNLISQLRVAGKNIVHLGDDTWHSLFPNEFDSTLTRAYDSFNVWDLHTVDNGVIEHVFPLLQPGNSTKWDVLIGHFLGVDHAGHRYGPNHPAMREKLLQMDGVIRHLKNLVDDETLLVVMGDHGMDSKGDHGGESDDEVEAALWMYSKQPVFGRTKTEFARPPATAKERPVGQIDLVPTLAFLLGLPVPFNNLGSPIEEAFAGKSGNDWRTLATVNRLTAAQIKRYQKEYALAKGEEAVSDAAELWAEADRQWETLPNSASSSSPKYETTYGTLQKYQHETLRVCRSLWASFNKIDMVHGIIVLATGLVFLVSYTRALKEDVSLLAPAFLRRIFVGTAIGVPISLLQSMFLPDASSLSLFGAAMGGSIGALSTLYKYRHALCSPLPKSIWGLLSFMFTTLLCIGFAANSWTIFEDEILLFFVATFAVLALVYSLRQNYGNDRFIATYHAPAFLILIRLASTSRLCRDEQMPYCRSTYYASSTSSTSAPWQLLLPYLSACFLPSVIKNFYSTTKSYEASAVFWYGIAFRTCLFLIAIFWTLDAADDGNWFPGLGTNLKTIRVLIAQLTLAISVGVGIATFSFSKPCIKILIRNPDPPSISSGPTDPPTPQPSSPNPLITINGHANPYATHYLLLITSLFLPLLLLQTPMGNLTLTLTLYSLLALLELLSHLHLAATSPLAPTLLALLGQFSFFKTGHQATLSSIQWSSAFIPLHSLVYPLSPLLVILNTFAGPILLSASVPLIVLWRRPITPGNKSRGILADVSRAYATFVCVWAAWGLATTVWAWWLRRHLMVYRVFGPRFMMAAVEVLVVEVVGVVMGLGGLRVTLDKVGEVFGW
ncbi:MAG: hypothetical protein Q9227_007732 [Pyrenula ochraceoflavens]